MNLKRGSLRYNFIMNTLLQGSAWLIPFAIRPYVSRILLPDGMGHVGFAISQLYYFILIATLGRIPSVVTSTVGGNALGTKSYGFAAAVFIGTLLISLGGLVLYQRLQKRNENT